MEPTCSSLGSLAIAVHLLGKATLNGFDQAIIGDNRGLSISYKA
jgi:hypothetical protein